ncbi:MAG: NADH-quinone oxidoreductase subunit M [Candidatus Tectomicrobia bacterium]|uniref:NADH-quinone oxidoreductase subunit M n=1 Tax=Tectimicrobiota bacterium TaxID=2528274 RepID=A0A933GJ08_UNCTE|nr:NADH-quinone oxidoreductase subunit M [Candidatus Tectomicrobia bacterium]
MNLGQLPLLSLITFFPIYGVVILLFVNRNFDRAIKTLTFVVTLLNFFFSLSLYFLFDDKNPGMQFVEKIPWIKQYGISYFVGIDGISLLLVLLTTFLTFLSVLASWKAITNRVKEYMISMLMLETGMLGVFVSLDLFLFYIFWEVMLIPMYLLIGVWGGPRRIYAAVKFFIYTMTGSVLMLVAILFLYFFYHSKTGLYSFSLLDLYGLQMPINFQYWLFLAFALAFAIKVPMFPFHTWLPDAHVEAPTAGSVILAGVLLKMGTYGFIRFNMPLFPEAAKDPTIVSIFTILAVIGIIYGALVSMMQTDIKKLVAYSSVSHLGFVMLGLFAYNMQGVEGGILQMVNHGLSTGALFLIVGIIYERRHTRMIDDFGGLTKQIPLFAAFFMIVTLSSVGLPGLNGFVGEFLILLGSFQSYRVLTILAATGVILAACYMLWMYQRVMFGKLDKPENQSLKDLSARELAYLIPIVAVIFWIGIYPQSFLRKMDASVSNFLKTMNSPLRADKLPGEGFREFSAIDKNVVLYKQVKGE